MILYEVYKINSEVLTCQIFRGDTMSSMKEIVISNFKGVQRGTDFILKAVPKDKLDYAPTKDVQQKLGDLARHIAVLSYTGTLFVEGGNKERPNPDQMKKILADKFGSDLANNNYSAVFNKACEHFLNFYSKKSDDELVKGTFTNFINTSPTPFLKGFLSIEDHLVQHRGTLFAYLRALNVPVTMKQYFGMEELH